MNTLSCKACGAPLSADALDRRLAIITCTNCGAIFDLSRKQDREAEGRGARAKEDPVRAPVALPDRFKLDVQGRNLTIRWRWFQPAMLFLIPFAIAWNSFLVVWYAAAFSIPAEGGAGGFDLLMVVFPIGHVCAGVVVTYLAITNVLNSSRITISDRRLAVRHGPLPWWPSPTVEPGDLEQLYVTRKVNRGKNGVSVTFELRAVTRTDKSLLMVGGLSELDQALWLEQELERRLDIVDRAVAGEFKGGEEVRV